MMPQPPRHKVFISFHERDRNYKDRFVEMMRDHVVDKSVDTGNIADAGLSVDEIRRQIRNDYISDATVTVVLIGPCTWQRKHVDFEISASLIDRQSNPRCGLLGIRLPIHPDFKRAEPNLQLLPPRLADNCLGRDPFARLYRWSGSDNEVDRVRTWIDHAFERRVGTDPDNSRDLFGRNWNGNCSTGWRY